MVMQLRPGDYVLASKFSDGHPRDPWAVGFFKSNIDGVPDRFDVVDSTGESFRRNGFRRVKRISDDVGSFLLQRAGEIECGSKSIWWWEKYARKNMG